MDPGDLRRRLLEERRRALDLMGDLEAWGLGEAQRPSLGELSSYDQHTADLGAENFGRAQDMGLRARAGHLLAQVDAALARMEEGTYGICQTCGRPIPTARLRALPYAANCQECQREQEARWREADERPAEEDRLEVPFARSFRGGSYAAFDGEDAWQQLARFGNANTPQDEFDAVEYGEVVTGGDEDVGFVSEVEAVADVEGTGVSNLEAIYPEPADDRRRRRRAGHQEDPGPRPG